MKSKKLILSAGFSVVLLVLTGCGSNSEQQVKALCEEAHVALAEMSSGDLYDSLNLASVKIRMLSEEASGLGEDQLARDFLSVGDDIYDVFSAYVGYQITSYGDNEMLERYNEAVDKFVGNGALRVAGQRVTFIECE